MDSVSNKDYYGNLDDMATAAMRGEISPIGLPFVVPQPPKEKIHGNLPWVTAAVLPCDPLASKQGSEYMHFTHVYHGMAYATDRVRLRVAPVETPDGQFTPGGRLMQCPPSIDMVTFYDSVRDRTTTRFRSLYDDIRTVKASVWRGVDEFQPVIAVELIPGVVVDASLLLEVFTEHEAPFWRPYYDGRKKNAWAVHIENGSGDRNSLVACYDKKNARRPKRLKEGWNGHSR